MVAGVIGGDSLAPAPDDAPNANQEPLAVDSAKLQKRLKRIEKANRLVMELNAEVAERDSEVKAAKGRLTTAQEDRDSAVVELSRIISDTKAGQDLLFEPEEELAAENISSDNTPISELGSKQLRKLVGADFFDAAKNREEPIGLSAAQLDKLEAAEIRTISDLETRMREVRDWWLVLAKDPAAGVVTRVSDSLAAYRSKCPVEQTILEKLTELNESAPSSGDATQNSEIAPLASLPA
jgi:hypothetical protein